MQEFMEQRGSGEMRMRETISCAIVVFNEEGNIGECLEAAKWMDEIVVVDAYSTDRTREICGQYTPRIYERPWRGFGEQKNFAISQATADWVFILDADERISSELRGEIEDVLASRKENGPVAYYVPRRNFYYGRWVKRAGCYPDYQLRLFRRGIGRLDDQEPHNKFVFEGRAEYLATPLDHYTERTIDDHFRKFRNFTSLAAEQRWKSKKTVHWADLTVRPAATFYKYYVTRRGFRDGMHGLLVSAFASMYTFVKYAKVWERSQAERSQLPE